MANSCQGMLISSIVWAYIIGAACAVMSKMARAFGGKLPSMSKVGTMGMVLLAFPEFSICRDRVLIYIYMLMKWCVYVWLIDFFRFYGMCDVLRIPSSASSREGLVVGLLVGYIHVQSCLDTTWYNLRWWITCRCTMIPIIYLRSRRWILRYRMSMCTVPLTLALCCILLSHIISKLRGFCNGHLCQRIDDFNSMAQDQETSNAKTETETERWNLFIFQMGNWWMVSSQRILHTSTPIPSTHGIFYLLTFGWLVW